MENQDPYAKEKLYAKIGLAVGAVIIAVIAWGFFTTTDEEKARFDQQTEAIVNQ